jgi:hypothetical protein
LNFHNQPIFRLPNLVLSQSISLRRSPRSQVQVLSSDDNSYVHLGRNNNTSQVFGSRSQFPPESLQLKISSQAKSSP